MPILLRDNKTIQIILTGLLPAGGQGYGSSTALQLQSKSRSIDNTSRFKRPRHFVNRSRSLSQEYLKFQEDHNTKALPKRFNTRRCSQEKFVELATESSSGRITRGSIEEARAILQAKSKGIISRPARLSKTLTKIVNLDFKVKGKYSFCDVKTPVGSKILKKQNQAETLVEMAYNLGKNIAEQKNRFVGLKQGPKSAEQVLHLIDMWYVPHDEKPIVLKHIFRGWDPDKGVAFLKDK